MNDMSLKAKIRNIFLEFFCFLPLQLIKNILYHREDSFQEASSRII